MMENILFLAHTDLDGKLSKASLEVFQAAHQLAAQLGGSLSAGLVGGKIQAAADQVGAAAGVKFFGVEGGEFEASRYATDILAVDALVKESKATVVIAATSTRFQRALPGAAFRLGGKIDTHVSGVQAEGGKITAQRWFYRQRMMGSLSRSKRPWFLLADSGIAAAWSESSKPVSISKVSVTVPDSAKRTQVLGIESAGSDAQTIRPDAEVLFVAGAGWTKKQADGQAHVKEAEKIILDFLTKSKSSLGSSKSLVDQSGEGQEVISYMSHLNQVGQTGSSPRHAKGLSTCCHGEEPHVVGWRFINERRAINMDANCGWAQGKTDVLYVADAFEVMKKVNALLS